MVAIEQKTTNKNPRSTVGTVTEINDFLRLLYARASRAYSPVTGEEMVHYTDDQIAELILEGFTGRRIALTAPIVRGRKGHYRELFESLAKKGYIYARIDGEIRGNRVGHAARPLQNPHDRSGGRPPAGGRGVARAADDLAQGGDAAGQGARWPLHDYGSGQQRYYSRHLMCPSTGVAFEDPARTPSRSTRRRGLSPLQRTGRGGGVRPRQDRPRSRTLRCARAVEPLGKYRNNMLFAILEMLGRRHDFTLDDPIRTLSESALNALLCTAMRSR